MSLVYWSMLSQKEWENRNHLTSVSHETVISYQFGKVRYILTEDLFARYVMKDAQISQKCKHMLQVKYETLWLVTRS